MMPKGVRREDNPSQRGGGLRVGIREWFVMACTGKGIVAMRDAAYGRQRGCRTRYQANNREVAGALGGHDLAPVFLAGELPVRPPRDAVPSACVLQCLRSSRGKPSEGALHPRRLYRCMLRKGRMGPCAAAHGI